MGVREIKTTIAIDGERQFSSALREAQRGLRVLQSELKAESSAFDANTSAMQRSETRAKSLRAQIEQQKRIVEALRGAVADSAKKWGENSQQADGYRIKLANARSVLNDMTRDLEEAERASDGLNGSLKRIEPPSWEELGSAASAAGDVMEKVAAAGAAAFGAVTAAAAGAAKGVADMVAETSVQADNLLTQSLQTGIDAQTLQAWSYAARFVDTEVSSITDSIKKLRLNMQKSSSETGINDALTTLGVKATDAAGRYRDAQDVFWDVIDAAHENIQGLNETELDTALQALTGKGYTDLLPLISAGRQGWEDAMARAYAGGLVMDQETIDAFGAYNDKLQEIDAAWAGIKNSMAAIALEYADPIAEDIGSIATAFNRFLRGEEGAEDDLATQVDKLFTDAQTAMTTGWEAFNTTVDTLTASENPSTQKLGAALGAARDALAGIAENKDTYVAAMEAVLAVMVGSKAVAAAANMASAATSLAKMAPLMSEFAPIALAIGGFTAAGAGIQAAADAMEQQAQQERQQGAIRNAGKYADVIGGRDILQAYADKVHAEGWGAITWQDMEPIFDAFGQDRGADVLAELEKYKLTGGERWEVPESWFDVGSAAQQVISDMQGALDEGGLTVAPALPEDWGTAAQSAMQGALNGMRLTVPVTPVMGTAGSGTMAGRWVAPMIEGSHAGGLDYVPHDGYIAELHKGEGVLRAAENAQYQAQRRRGGADSAQDSAAMRRAIGLLARMLGGVSMQIDGEVAGRLLAQSVSESLAGEMMEG